jgi:hypothetical protein
MAEELSGQSGVSGDMFSGLSDEGILDSEPFRLDRSDPMDQNVLGSSGGGRKRWSSAKPPVMTEVVLGGGGGFMLTNPTQSGTLHLPSSSINGGGTSEDKDSVPEVIPETSMDSSNSPPPASVDPVHPVSH